MIRLKLDLQSMTVEDKVTIGHSIADGLDAQKKKFSKPPVAPADLRSRATSLDAKRKARVAAKAALSKAVKEEVIYELERATSGDGPFSHADKFSKAHGALDDEKSSQKMWYRLAALATDDKRGEFCAPISIVVP